MQSEKFLVDLVDGQGRSQEGELILGEVDPDLSERVRLTLLYPGGRIIRHDSDYFAALCEIRRALDAKGLRINCYAASRNVWLPGSAREQNYGYYACKLTKGRPVGKNDWVRVFDSGPDVELATAEEQEKFHREWLESLGWVFNAKGEVESRKLRYNPYNPPKMVVLDLAVFDAWATLKKKAAHWMAEAAAAYHRRHAHR